MLAVIEDQGPQAAAGEYRLVAVAPAGGAVNFTLDQVSEAQEYAASIAEGVEVLKLLRRRRDKAEARKQRRRHGKQRGPRS